VESSYSCQRSPWSPTTGSISFGIYSQCPPKVNCRSVSQHMVKIAGPSDFSRNGKAARLARIVAARSTEMPAAQPVSSSLVPNPDAFVDKHIGPTERARCTPI